VCITEGTFVCVLGSHTPEFLEKFCALYDPLYPGRKLGVAKYGLDPNKDPMRLFEEQRAYIVPACCLVFWTNRLLHGHAIVGRDERMQIGFYQGYQRSISAQQRMECQESYLNGTVPRLYPSGDNVCFYPRKFLNLPDHFKCVAKKLSAEARAELVTTRVTKAGKEVLHIHPWGWPKDHCFTPFQFTKKGKCIVGIEPWEGFREPDAPPSDNGGIAQAAGHDQLAAKIRVVDAANGGMAQARASKKRPLGDSESVHDGEVQMPARQEQDNCIEQSHTYFATSMANAVRGVALAVWGTQPRDRMLIAEMSVNGSITELIQAENTTKKELAILVERVRALPVNKNKAVLRDLLLKSRGLRNTLTTMGKKRMGMEKQLETLRQSQMNQNMLISMKHTSEALQTLGMKVSDADSIMLDLEDSASDMTNLQSTLSTSYYENDFTDMDLGEELALLLGDDDAEPIRHIV